MPGSSVRDAWARDLHLGVVAGSDCHRGAHEFLLTGLYAEACTPDAIWQALWAFRRTFATTRGKRLIVDFTADGFPVGARYATDAPPQLDVTIRGAGPIARVELWRQGELWRTEDGRGRVELTVGYRDLRRAGPARHHVLGARVPRGRTAAWSSPIWVAILPEYPAARGFLYWQPDEPARLEVDVVRRTGRQAELLVILRNEDLDGAVLTEPTLEIREGGSGRAIARERLESLSHFRDGALRAVVDGRPSRQPALSGNLSRWPRHAAPRSANAPHSPGRSSPMNTDTAYRLYWGDLHRQSNVSDGEGDLAEHFRVARDEAGLDFYAMTDHAVLTADPCDRAYMGPSRVRPPSPMRARRTNWVTWSPCTESRTPLGGHCRISSAASTPQNASSRSWDMSGHAHATGIGASTTSPTISRSAFLARCPSSSDAGGRGCHDTPHHTGYARGRRGTNWNVHNPILERNVEVVSLHGCSEEPRGGYFPLNNIGMGSNVPGGSVQDALARGYHLGLVGGSDGHRPRDPYVLTGVYAPALTRDALWDALYHRRTVATTGAQRIHLAFRMDGEWQGSLLALDTLPHFTIDAEGTAPITRAELIENGEVVQTWPGTGNRIVVNERLSRVPERPDNYYYVRLLQSDGNLAWSSPIWVSYLPELPEARGYLYWLPRVGVRFEVALEATPGPRSVVCLRCLNDDLERQSISAVSLDASGIPGWSRSTRAPLWIWPRDRRSIGVFASRRSSLKNGRSSTCGTRIAIAIADWCGGGYVTHDGSARR